MLLCDAMRCPYKKVRDDCDGKAEPKEPQYQENENLKRKPRPPAAGPLGYLNCQRCKLCDTRH